LAGSGQSASGITSGKAGFERMALCPITTIVLRSRRFVDLVNGESLLRQRIAGVLVVALGVVTIWWPVLEAASK
jgi:hypothetical protein